MFLTKKQKPGFPRLLENGKHYIRGAEDKISLSNEKNCINFFYLILEKLGPNLGFLSATMYKKFSKKSVA